jgi:isopentenyl diphosphate isomerase/L-lactate dehydrogenase-like FMN-dependent dehydrogenase
LAQNLDASFDWAGLQRLRDAWHHKLLVKGVARGEDAERLASLGVDGVWVSNHGGRQLDGAIASADALPEVAQAVAGRIPVLVDSGVRRGVDIVKAVALGAQAVAVGRATLYGAAAGGEAGAARALSILTDELRRAMQLCGTPRVADIGPALLQANVPTQVA